MATTNIFTVKKILYKDKTLMFPFSTVTHDYYVNNEVLSFDKDAEVTGESLKLTSDYNFSVNGSNLIIKEL